VLDDGVDVTDHHGEPKSESDLLDQDAEVQELFHGSDGTSVWA
jgi:hypothetical protein